MNRSPPRALPVNDLSGPLYVPPPRNGTRYKIEKKTTNLFVGFSFHLLRTKPLFITSRKSFILGLAVLRVQGHNYKVNFQINQLECCFPENCFSIIEHTNLN